MTLKLLTDFFEAFDIPPLCCKEYRTNCTNIGGCEECEHYDFEFSTYPKLTDFRFLQLFCILFNFLGRVETDHEVTPQTLISMVLRKLIIFKSDVYTQVKEVFGRHE